MLDDDDVDPFMFDDQYHEEEQTAACAGMASQHVNDMQPCEGNFFMQPPEDDPPGISQSEGFQAPLLQAIAATLM